MFRIGSTARVHMDVYVGMHGAEGAQARQQQFVGEVRRHHHPHRQLPIALAQLLGHQLQARKQRNSQLLLERLYLVTHR